MVATESIFASCTERCGWTAAVIAVLSWGSFGVPIKTNVQVDVHPLVMQTYKTLVCFLTSWLVILLGEEVRWTSWGILSGLFWVPGAMAGIYGIRNAGLAIAVGTWSSIGVLTSFFFGIVIFQEGVKNFVSACFAFSCLIVGLIGMSRYSSTPASASTSLPAPFSSEVCHKDTSIVPSPPPPAHEGSGGGLIIPMELEPLVDDDEAAVMGTVLLTADDEYRKKTTSKDRFVFCGGRFSFTRRQTGVLGAIVNGAWGSLNLVPLHFARDQGMGGAAYLISFAGGALLVQTALWIGWFLYYFHQKRGNWREAVDALPNMHWQELGYPGFLAGLLYSTGNFMSILAVTYLGQGTGYSFTQMQLFVSGLWGVFYFKEIHGTETVIKWFTSALIAIAGIVWLSYEHEGDGGGHRRSLHYLVDSLYDSYLR